MSKEIRPMFWISGNYYDCQRIWNDLLSKIGDANILNFHCGPLVDTSAAHAADIILALKHRDIFDDRTRIIRMQNLPEDYTRIADYLYLVDDDNILVVNSLVGYRKKRFITAASSKFYKTIKKEGTAFIFDDEAKNDSTAITWLKKVVKDSGGAIESDAASFLVKEVAGRNYDLLYAHIRKLIDYSVKMISVEDVKASCMTAYQRSIYDLLDSLDYGKFDAATRHLQAFYDHAGTEVGTTFKNELDRLYGLLVSHFTALLLIKSACGDNISYQRATKALGGFKKKSKSGKWDLERYNNRYIGALVNTPAFQSALRWDKRRIFMIICDLHRARVYNRVVAKTKAESCTNLDLFTMVVCNKISLDNAAQLREM